MSSQSSRGGTGLRKHRTAGVPANHAVLFARAAEANEELGTRAARRERLRLASMSGSVREALAVRRTPRKS